MAHLLDRPVWNALTTRQQGLAVGDPARALRFHPEYNLFAAAAKPSEAALQGLADLVGDEVVGMVEADEWPLPPGTSGERRPTIHQMVAERIPPGDPIDHLELGDADAPEMLALARMTDPGPFFARTHRLGGFIGIRHAGRLIAMAGERMKVPGFTEVSAVCTHPDHRGRGLAGALMRVVAERILARGDTAFLHTYAANAGAVRLYETLGFRFRAEMRFTIVRRQ
jgi:predicted GNAT family acetyltransferase